GIEWSLADMRGVWRSSPSFNLQNNSRLWQCIRCNPARAPRAWRRNSRATMGCDSCLGLALPPGESMGAWPTGLRKLGSERDVPGDIDLFRNFGSIPAPWHRTRRRQCDREKMRVGRCKDLVYQKILPQLAISGLRC